VWLTPVPVGPAEGVVALAEMEKLRLALGDVAFTATDELDTPVPVGPAEDVVPFAEMEKLLLALVAVALAVIGAECVWSTVVPFSVHKLVNVVKLVALTLGVVAFTTTEELFTPVPVGPTVGEVEFAIMEKPLLALLVVVPLPVGPTEGVVALAVTENPLLALAVEVALPVIGAEWVCSTVVPFSVHMLVNVVNCVAFAEVGVVAADVVSGETTAELLVVPFALLVALIKMDVLGVLDVLELLKLDEVKMELVALDVIETELLALDETKLDEAEPVVVAFALTVGIDKEAEVEDEEELSRMVETGCEWVCTIAVPFSVHVVLFDRSAPVLTPIRI